MSVHWHAPSPPATTRIDLRIEAVPIALSIDCRESDVGFPKRPATAVAGMTVISRQPLNFAAAPPRVISIPIIRPKVRVRNFTFPEPSTLPPPAVSHDAAALLFLPTRRLRLRTAPASSRPVTSSSSPIGCTISCSRRWNRCWPKARSRFPVRPFPFQFEGIAFLYPRQAAILADEMGLGKTMQAITAIRLLLRRGEVRTVLLVCPKPLVTNWQREFALWAPEVPLMVIEGDQAKRGWQWTLPDVPLRVANYELLLRDRDLLAGQAFDLVVFDESQRIKNRSGSTNEVVCSISRKRNWAPDRHAGREQRRRPVGHLRVPRPRLPLAGDEAPQHGPIHPRLRPAAHQGPGARATCRRN